MPVITVVVGGLVIVYRKIGHMIMKSSPKPKLDSLDNGALTAVLYIGAAMYTKEMLVSSGILPADILK